MFESDNFTCAIILIISCPTLEMNFIFSRIHALFSVQITITAIACFFQLMFFFLLQTEQGDIFKCTLETDEEMVIVTGVRMKYFDTTLVVSSKTGFLFVDPEFGNQYVLIAS